MLATQGLQGFINALVTSDEYEANFGDSIVPFQRRRVLPQRSEGDLPSARMPRYGEDYRQQLEALGYFRNQRASSASYRWEWQKPPYPFAVRAIGAVITLGGAALVTGLFLAIALSAVGIIHI